MNWILPIFNSNKLHVICHQYMKYQKKIFRHCQVRAFTSLTNEISSFDLCDLETKVKSKIRNICCGPSLDTPITWISSSKLWRLFLKKMIGQYRKSCICFSPILIVYRYFYTATGLVDHACEGVLRRFWSRFWAYFQRRVAGVARSCPFRCMLALFDAHQLLNQLLDSSRRMNMRGFCGIHQPNLNSLTSEENR